LNTALLQPEAAIKAGPLSPEDLSELLAAFNDVTARLQATHETLSAEVSRLRGELGEVNRQLRRARELAALGEMAAGIAHEIRNPLGSIKLYAGALVEDLEDRPAERGIATKIAGAVNRLNAVVGDVLTFSRELRIRPVVVPVETLVSRAIESSGIGSTGVSARWDGGGVEAMCDPGLVEQALANLIRNAAEASRDRGAREISVSASRTTMIDGSGRRLPALSVRVRDEGPGFPEEARERAFNPFFTTREAGTGLGLAIVHRIIDAHSGRVSIWNNNEKEPGADGATVEVVLPYEPDMIAEESHG